MDAALQPVPERPPLRVLHLDECLVAVSKPSGMLVHRDDHHPAEPAALQTVRDQVGRFLYPVHRLDRATSGVLLFAFSSRDAAALQRCMAEPSARKEYLALVRWPGSFPLLSRAWTCDRPLQDERCVARPAYSAFEATEVFRRCALCVCRIHTGRYHQIRRHLNHCGRHVLGDTTHGKGRLNALYRTRYGLSRLFLHAQCVVVRHPRAGDPLALVDPLPPELCAVIARLRAEAAEGDQLPTGVVAS